MDLKPFLKEIYQVAPTLISVRSIEELQYKIADLLQTYLGEFHNGSLYFGNDTPLTNEELEDLLSMQESDVEDYMTSIKILDLSSYIRYKDLNVKPNVHWAGGGIESVFRDLLNKETDFFSFPINISFFPDLYSCILTVYLHNDEDNQILVNVKLNELEDRIPLSLLEKTKEPKKYTGYYACDDGSMDALVVINKFNLNFYRGNTLKYIMRAGKKDPSKEIEDLEKANHYIDLEIERIKDRNR